MHILCIFLIILGVQGLQSRSFTSMVSSKLGSLAIGGSTQNDCSGGFLSQIDLIHNHNSTTIGNLKYPRCGLSSTLLNVSTDQAILFVAGGNSNEGYTNIVEQIHLSMNADTLKLSKRNELRLLSGPRAYIGSCFTAHQSAFVGGFHPFGISNALEIVTVNSGKVSQQLYSLDFGIAFHATACLETGYIAFAGGTSSLGFITNSVYIWNGLKNSFDHKMERFLSANRTRLSGIGTTMSKDISSAYLQNLNERHLQDEEEATDIVVFAGGEGLNTYDPTYAGDCVGSICLSASVDIFLVRSTSKQPDLRLQLSQARSRLATAGDSCVIAFGGGRLFGDCSNKVDIFNFCGKHVMYANEELSVAREDAVGSLVDGVLLFFGGSTNNGDVSNVVDQYRISDLKWKSIEKFDIAID